MTIVRRQRKSSCFKLFLPESTEGKFLPSMAFSFRLSHLSANIKPNVVVQFDPGVSLEPQVRVSVQSYFLP